MQFCLTTYIFLLVEKSASINGEVKLRSLSRKIHTISLLYIDLPTQTNFTSNITISQRVVSESDFGPPHYFRYNNDTNFILPNWPVFSQNEYVIVCKASTYQYNIEQSSEAKDYSLLSERNGTFIQSLALRLGAESLHITSCDIPYHWMKLVFQIVLGLSAVFVVVSTILFVSFFVCICKWHRDKLCNPCIVEDMTMDPLMLG